MTIGVVVTLTMQPGKGPAFEDAMRAFIPVVKAHEPGTLIYTLAKDDKGPVDEYVMIEHYATQADLDAHGKTAHFMEFVGKIGPLLAGPPKMQRLTILA
jgi:quinol monooxygenase YgiN